MSESILFERVRLFDGIEVTPETSVLVRGDRIEAVSKELANSGELHTDNETVVVSGVGKTLLPGLIDCHIHLRPGALEQSLRFGVSTMLDMSIDPEFYRSQRTLAETHFDMADIRSAGWGASTPGGYGSTPGGFHPSGSPRPTIASVEDAENFVADRVSEGSDYIKLFGSALASNPDQPSLSLDVMAALASAAHSRGLIAVAHALDQDAAYRALLAGVEGLVHLPYDAPLDPRVLARLQENGAFVVPTMTFLETHSPGYKSSGILEDPRLRTRLFENAIPALENVIIDPVAPGYHIDNASSAVPLLYDAGVKILAGSDTTGSRGRAFGASLHRELELLVDAGLTPLECLRGATAWPAECFSLNDRGRVAPGFLADLLLVDGDPTERITDTRNFVSVYRSGVLLEG